MGRGGVRVQFTVGLKLKGKTDHIAVDAEDALIAALSGLPLRSRRARRVLAPLAALAERCSVTVLAVTHDRKGGGAAGERTLGSVAFTAAPRAVWAVTLEKGEDGEATGRTIFTRVKDNLGPDPAGLPMKSSHTASEADQSPTA
jgi:hypothetical protein